MSEVVKNPCFGCTRDTCRSDSGELCSVADSGFTGGGINRSFVALITADVRTGDLVQLLRECQEFLDSREKSKLLAYPRMHLGRSSCRDRMIGWDVLEGGSPT